MYSAGQCNEINTVNNSVVNSTIIKVQHSTVNHSTLHYIEVHIAYDTGSNHVLLQWSCLEQGMCEYSALQLALFTVCLTLNIVYIMRGVMCTV